jgi:hypothetical protein
MRRYKTIDELHTFLEKQAHRIIRFYYTDWKNYDRPELMRHTGNKEREIYIIFREAGSYLYTADELTDPERDFPAVVMDYYATDNTAKYYRVNLDALTVEEIPAGLPAHIKAERARLERMSA